MLTKGTISISLLLFFVYIAHAGELNPINYGILNAKTGIERYNILLKVHKDAVEKNTGVTYDGISVLEIEVPENATSIPLSYYTDFANVEFLVKNNSTTLFLFSMRGKANRIKIDKQCLKKYDFRTESMLQHGNKILIIEDDNPWIKQRIGYEVGVIRKDVLYLKNGKATNLPVQPYTTEASNPSFSWFYASDCPKIVKNIVFNRSKDSSKQTRLLYVCNNDNVIIRNISITTPCSGMYADQAISLENCSNVICEDLIIEGTYSKSNKYGYGIWMDNVWNSSFIRVKGDAEWGIFGTYNVSKVILEDCEVNRFDIHCYGKDVTCKGCVFRRLYNQFSSLFGNVVFKDCEFDNFIPFLVESSFNSYTPFNLAWENCRFNLDKKHNYLITLFGVPGERNERPEISTKCLPNIRMNNCNIRLTDDVDTFYVVWTGGVKWEEPFDYISKITIRGLSISGKKNTSLLLFSEDLRLANRIRTRVRYKIGK